ANKGKRDYGKWTDANFCFNLDANGHPKVEYTGYEIYDAQKHAYVQLKIIGEFFSLDYRFFCWTLILRDLHPDEARYNSGAV
ncbi:hypothetical protein, partial [Hornefia butyriciproducens]|uniref:hypothetical protein n=1 Tax=Hornefia butyriciproducens TaxID=2652293 RepID=UPI0023F1013E